MPLLAVPLEGIGDRVRVEFFEKFVARSAHGFVEPQVERSLRAESEPAVALQLVGGETEVEQHAVGVFEPEFGEDGEKVDMRGVNEVNVRGQTAVGVGQGLGCSVEHLGVSVEPDERSRFADPFEDGLGMTSAAHRAVDDDEPRFEIEEVQNFPEENRTVNGTA